MPSDKRAKAQATKSKLKVLKSKGLYSGDLRKAPTRYAEGLTRKFSDVLAGKAEVVTVPRVTRAPAGTIPIRAPGGKGVVAARKTAKALAEEYSIAVRAKGNKLIVQKATAADRVIYSPRARTLELVRPFGDDQEERIPLRKEMHLTELPDNTIDFGIRKLRADESYAVPFRGKNGGIRYVYFGSHAELMAAINEYGPRWGDIPSNVTIARLKTRKRK